MKKLITWLYNRYCKPQIKSLYLSGIQRDLGKELNKHDEKNRDEGCISFKESGALEFVVNEVVREYVELLFNVGENQKIRDLAHNNINVVLRLEERIKMYSNKPQVIEPEDIHNPL